MDNILIIIRHAFISFIGSILITALGFFLKFYLVHNFIDATFSFGVFALGVSMIEFFTPLSTFGFGGVSVRYLPKWGINNNLNNRNNFITFIGFVTLSLSCLYVILLYFNQDKLFSIFNLDATQNELIVFLSFLPLFLALMLVKNLISIISQFLIGFQEVKKSVIVSDFIGFPLKVILVVIFIYFGLDFAGYLYAEIISATVVLLVLLYFLKQIISKDYCFNISLDWFNKKILIYSLTFFLLGLLTKFSLLLDKWLINEHMSLKNLGIYYMTFAFIDFFPFVLKSINKIFAPIISETWERKDLNELSLLYRFFTKWTVLLSFPLVFFIVFFSNDLLLLFGSEFVGGQSVLIILAIAHSFSIMLGSVGIILQMTDNHVKAFKIAVFRTVIVIVLLFVLVPRFQMEGAAFALSIGIVIFNTLNYILLYRKLKLIPYNRDFWRICITILFASFVLIISFNYLDDFIPNMYWYWLVMLLVCTYITTIIFSRFLCFSEKDKLVLMSLLSKMKK